MSCGDSSGGIVEVEEEGVAFGRGSEILTLDQLQRLQLGLLKTDHEEWQEH